MYNIGQWHINNRTILAPMAGVSDLPFRQLCKKFGAGLAVSEMVTCDSSLWDTPKSRSRLVHLDEAEPRSIQIAGSDPKQLALAAKLNQDAGADIIDINMGCPAKKVCKKAAGSALLRDEALVASILNEVVSAVNIPVTLKIRTGWCPDTKNGVTIAQMAEDCGVQALAVHGRTRQCRFKGEAEYDTIADIVSRVNIPVFANGNIDTPEKAQAVLSHTGASAVMLGRAAQGNPWLFSQINHFLETGEYLPLPTANEIRITLIAHLNSLHEFYGAARGVRIARKHVGWYASHLPFGPELRREFNQLTIAEQQYECVQSIFERLAIREEYAA